MSRPKPSVPAIAGTSTSSPILREDQKKLSFLPKFLCTGENRKLFIDWFSGLVSGFVSVTTCAPLDLARTRHMILVREVVLIFAKSSRRLQTVMDRSITKAFSIL